LAQVVGFIICVSQLKSEAGTIPTKISSVICWESWSSARIY